MSDFPEHDRTSTRVRRGGNRPEELAAARRTVAVASVGVEDRALLLEMLGLVPAGQVLTVAVP